MNGAPWTDTYHRHPRRLLLHRKPHHLHNARIRTASQHPLSRAMGSQCQQRDAVALQRAFRNPHRREDIPQPTPQRAFRNPLRREGIPQPTPQRGHSATHSAERTFRNLLRREDIPQPTPQRACDAAAVGCDRARGAGDRSEGSGPASLTALDVVAAEAKPEEKIDWSCGARVKSWALPTTVIMTSGSLYA